MRSVLDCVVPLTKNTSLELLFENNLFSVVTDANPFEISSVPQPPNTSTGNII